MATFTARRIKRALFSRGRNPEQNNPSSSVYTAITADHPDNEDDINMFVHDTTNLPKDPSFPAKLSDLGFGINDKSQIVSINPPYDFFAYWHSDSPRVNDVRKEAVHKCVRGEVQKQLGMMGVKTMYCTGERGIILQQLEPKEGPFVRILATEPGLLKAKRDVIVVIGDQSQDVGIWSYRSLLAEGGINGGSAVGLVKKLRGLDFIDAGDVNEEDFRRYVGRNDSVAAARDGSTTPGIIMLNPGQHLFSHEINDCMTQESWQAREKATPIDAPYMVDDFHNSINGHTTAFEHVVTFFEHILPQLINEKETRLWIVGITDGAEHFINYMDAKLDTDHNAHIGAMVNAMAFMEPTHNAKAVRCEAMRNSMHSYGRCWIKSSRPVGNFINSPGAMRPLKHWSDDLEDEKEGKVEEASSSSASTIVKPGHTEEPLPALTAKSGNEVLGLTAEDVDERTFKDMNKPIAGAEPIMIPKTLTTQEEQDKLTADMAKAGLTDEHYTSASLQSFSSVDSVNAILAKSSLPPALLAPLESDDENDKENDKENNKENDKENNQENMHDPMSDSYDYHKNTVSCPTFSGAVDMDELIWPNVMDRVLDFFKDKAEQDNQRLLRSGLAMRASLDSESGVWIRED